MNDTYEHKGQELNRPIAEKLILELFVGKTDVKKADIRRILDRVHTESGGKLSSRRVHPSTDALRNLRDQGLAANPQRGLWTIFSVSRAIFNKIEEIANLSIEGGYIYRGEPKDHEKVSSTLYRECLSVIQEAGLEGELVDFDMETVEKEVLAQVKMFAQSDEGTQDFSVLTQLQHYGSPTNLIDFTTDFHIALFFACDSQREEQGRVIVQKRDLVSTEEPSEPRHRVTSQKSVFVQPKQGYIDPDEVEYQIVYIPAKLKASMLEYLRNGHGISTYTIYNDIHGYIRNRGIHNSTYSEFYIAESYNQRADENPAEKLELWDKAIKHYSKAIKLMPDYYRAYYHRGTIYSRKKRYEKALEDLNKVIELDPELVLAYVNRGNIYRTQDEYEKALQDYDKAIELDDTCASAYVNRGNVYRTQDEYEKALQDYDKAIELDDTCASAYVNRGMVLLDIQRLDDAISDFHNALQLDPDNKNIYNFFGLIYSEQGNAAVAKGYFQEALQLADAEPEPDTSFIESVKESLQAMDTDPGDLFSVIMDNGAIIEETRGIDTFITVIVMLGIERVKSLQIDVNGIPLISEKDYPDKAQKVVDPYYIVSGTSTQKKKELLDEIAARLGEKMKVYVNSKP